MEEERDPELERILEKKMRDFLKRPQRVERPKYGKVFKLDSYNFYEEISKADLAIIDCWAEWCMPCRFIAPIIEELAVKYPDVFFGKLNVDENPIIAQKFFIEAIPTLLIFKKGKYIDRLVGALPKNVLEKVINSYRTI